MNALIVASLVLMAGSGLCLLPLDNRLRAGAGIASQLVATVLVWLAVVPVLRGTAEPATYMPWAYPVGELRFRLDALGAFFLSWSLPMTLLGAVYALGYLGRYVHSPRHLGVHFALLNMISLSFILVYTGVHTITFLLGWEMAALSAWLLVIWDYGNQKVRFAGFNYLVSTHIGLIFLVAAVMILYTHTQSWYLDDFGRWMGQNPGPLRNTVFLLLLASFGLKSAFFPFHSWLPRAHAAAPAHVSALMSGVIHKAGLFALLHFIFMSGKPDEWMGWALLAFSATSALIGALYTVGQRDLKRLLGYSSTENVGIAGMGIGLGTLGLSWNLPGLVALGFGGCLLHILNHALFKCLLFYAAGSVYQVKHVIDMERLGGLFRWMPVTSLCFLIGGVAISGLPPFNGFASEFLIYSGLFTGEEMNIWSRLALLVSAALLAFVGAVSALSITRAFGVIFLGHPRDSSLPAAHEPSRWMLLPLGVHAMGTVLLGLMPTLGLALVAAPTALALQGVSAPGAPAALLDLSDILSRVGLFSVVLAVLIALLWLLSHRLPQRPAQVRTTWGCGYTAGDTRMQYTGSGFSHEFAQNYQSLMVLRGRQKAPAGYFPTDSYVLTDCVDAVEQRLFNVIEHGDASASLISRLMHEDDPRLGFAAGLAAVLAISAIVLLSFGDLP